MHYACEHVRHVLQGGGFSALSHGAPASAQTVDGTEFLWQKISEIMTVSNSQFVGHAAAPRLLPCAMRGHGLMAAAVVPASVVTAHASTPSRSRFLGVRIERSRARVQRVSMPPFHPCRTGGTVVAEAESGADSPGAG